MTETHTHKGRDREKKKDRYQNHTARHIDENKVSEGAGETES